MFKKPKITKTYCRNLKARVHSISDFHQETWFYDDNGEFVFWALEHLGWQMWVDLWISWVEKNRPIISKQGFMKYDDMREEFYKALLDEDNRRFFLRQHDYL